MLLLLFSLLPILGFQQVPPDPYPTSQNEQPTLNEVIVRFRFLGGNKNGRVSTGEIHDAVRTVQTALGLDQPEVEAARPLHQGLFRAMEQSGETEAALLTRLTLGKHKRMRRDFNPATYKLAQTFVIKVPGEAEAWAERFKESSALVGTGIEVIDAVPNRISTTSGDPRYQDQWYLNNTGQSGGMVGADIGAEAAWQKSRGAGMVIAVVDTGVDYQHQDLAANIWTNDGEIPNNQVDDDGNGFVDDVRGWDFVATSEDCADGEDCGTADNDPMDIQGHGTHCAGLAAAPENGVGIVGAAPEARIMALRAGYKSNAQIGLLPDDAILGAVAYAAANGADVISMSFGRSGDGTPFPPEFQLAVDLGVVLVCAAGNRGEVGSNFPAAFPQTISVAASDHFDERPIFSNYGPTIDVLAPGNDILSTQPAFQHLPDSRGIGTNRGALARHPPRPGHPAGPTMCCSMCCSYPSANALLSRTRAALLNPPNPAHRPVPGA